MSNSPRVNHANRVANGSRATATAVAATAIVTVVTAQTARHVTPHKWPKQRMVKAPALHRLSLMKTGNRVNHAPAMAAAAGDVVAAVTARVAIVHAVRKAASAIP